MTPHGLDRFRAHFRSHVDAYILIGGTACSVQFEQIGASFRSTRDFDVLVLADGRHHAFLQAMSAFIVDGGYRRHIDARGRHRCFRFMDPHDETWPGKIEICARQGLTDDDTRAYFPLTRPADGADLISLSAILFDDTYVDWLVGGAETLAEVRVARMEYLLPLKALAWKNLTAAKARGEAVDGDDIRKHKLDCFRLINRIPPSHRIVLPDPIAADVVTFIEAMETEQPSLPADLSGKPVAFLNAMRNVYALPRL